MTVDDGSPFWQGLIPGASQDSVVTFTNIDTPVGEQHSNGVWTEDSIQVLYDTPNQRIQIWAYSAETGWTQRGEDIPVTFADSDVFRARALADGIVEIYQNGSLLAQDEMSALSQPAVSETVTPESLSLIQPIFTEMKPVSYQLPSDSVPDLPTDIFSSIEGLPLPALPSQQSSSLAIDYTYDALHRLTSAAYSDGRSFAYTYDAAGNVVELEKNLGPGTVVTTYTYDIASWKLQSKMV